MISSAPAYIVSGTYTATEQVVFNLKPDTEFLQVFLNVTAVAGSGTVNVLIEGKVPGANAWFTHLQSANVTGTGLVRLKIGNGLTPVSNLTANDLLTTQVRVTVTLVSGTSVTYSLYAI